MPINIEGYTWGHVVALVLIAALLSGCNALSRLSDIGSEPALSPIENPVAQPTYRSVSMPMPAPESVDRQANSLWRPGAKAFFKDQRASKVGDIVTVLVDIEDEATLRNTTARTRSSAEDTDVTSLLGYETSFGRILPQAIVPTDLISLGTESSSTGVGSVTREEAIDLSVAAIVLQVLPNGNLVIHGRQEVRVNFEVRELQVAGVIRPEDITSANTIDHTDIAEARISYGGHGQLTDVQQPRYGQQVLDVIMPF